MSRLKKIMVSALAVSALAIGVSAANPAFALRGAPTPTPEPTATPVPEKDIKVSQEYKDYEKIAQYITQYYIDDTLEVDDVMLMGLSKYLEDNDGALDSMLKSMLSSLDPYCEFMTAEEFTEFENSIDQTFYGIGVEMRQNDEYVEIVGFVEENGLAEESGFMVGDKIVRVNGADVVGWSLDDIRNRIIGEVNTTVNITVLRGEEYIDLVGIRTEVRQNTVRSAVFKKNIGYIQISSFGLNTADEFEAVLRDFSARGVVNVILDLRGNTGGRLDAAVKIAEKLVPAGKIVDVKYRESDNDITYNSNLQSRKYSLIVLVDGNTASASEILASAIQDSRAGRLLGTRTYGKAVVQQAFPLNNGSVFKLTVAQYITRNGHEINNIGLTPDIFVVNTREPIDATKYTSFDFRTKWAVGDSGRGVKAAKERLQMLNYYKGATDSEGFYKDLQSAVKSFQLDEGLVPYGVIDIPTQVKMESRFEQLQMTQDNQLETAYKTFGGNISDLYGDGAEE